VRAHLHLLARLSHALREPDLERAVTSQAGREELLAAVERCERGMATPGEASSP
jgi:hypothetical protein